MTRTLCITFGLLLGFIVQARGQEFQVSGSNFADEAYTIKRTSTGDYLLAGGYERDGFDTAEVLLIKTTADGDTLWVKTYGSEIDSTHFSAPSQSRHLSGGNIGYDIHEREDGSFIIGGVAHFFGEGMGDSYLLNVSADGDLLWSKSYGGLHADILFSILPQSDGGYIMGGLTESFGIEARGGICIRVDAFGDTLWTKVVSNEFIDEYHSLSPTSGTDFLAAGTTFAGIENSSDIRVSRFTEDGELLWEKTYGGPLNEFCTKIIDDAEDGFLLVGNTESFGAGDRDAFCMKIDASGELIWSKAYGGTDIDDAHHIEKLNDGNFLIIGNTASYGAGNDDLLALKISPDGQVIWSKAYGGNFYDYGRSSIEEENGDLIFVGYGSSFDQYADDFFIDNDIFIIRTDSMGETSCHFENIELKAIECATEQNTYEPTFISGTEVHDPPTVEGFTFSGVWDGCEPPVVGIDHHDTQVDLVVFPNPCSEQFQFSINEISRQNAFTLVNTQGIAMSIDVRKIGAKKFEIDVSKLASGVYMLLITSESSSFGGKVIVE